MKIGELARAAGCDAQTIRYYERKGFLAPAARTRSNYRAYGPEQLGRLRFIRHCRALDMSLEEIGVLLRLRDSPESACGEASRVLGEHLRAVRARLADLAALELQLGRLRRRCREVRAAKDCGILSRLGALPEAAAAGRARAPRRRSFRNL